MIRTSRFSVRAGAGVFRLFLPVVFAAAVSVPLPARAGPLFELTGGAYGRGGFNARTAGASAASTYFNPALIPFADPGLEVGVFVLNDQIAIDLDSRGDDAADVPEGVRNYARADGSPLSSIPLPTSWLENGYREGNRERDARPRQGAGSSDKTSAFTTVGLVNRIFDQYLVLGLYAMIPMGGFTAATAFYNDEREQFFSNSLHPELYSDRLAAAELAFGVAGRVYERLSIGMSFTLNLKNEVYTPVYVPDAGRLNETSIDSNIDVTTAVSPHFGAVFDAHDRLRFVATVHTPQSMEIETDFTYLLNNGQEQGSTISFTHGYIPWSAALGASYDLIHPPETTPESHTLTAVATVVFCDWSFYRDRHDETAPAEYEWARTFTPSLGARYSIDNWKGFLDITYVPTPVPPQTGRTNYVDNDRLGFNGGFEHHFQLFDSWFRAGLQLQLHRLLPRYQKKLSADGSEGEAEDAVLVIDEVPDDAVDRSERGEPAAGRKGLQTNNPGWPGFGSEGWLFGGGVNLAFLF
jgi:hypothetical protein